MADKQLLAGAAASVITPSLGASLCGSMQDRTAVSVHDVSGSAKFGIVVPL